MYVPVEREGTAETLVSLHQTTRRHNNLHRHHHDKLSSQTIKLNGLLYQLKDLLCTDSVELGHKRVCYIAYYVTDVLLGFMFSCVPSCLSVGLLRPSLCMELLILTQHYRPAGTEGNIIYCCLSAL